MKPYALVTGDFVRTGGMDRANFALAQFLARRNHEVHLVAHRVDPALLELPGVIFHRVPKVARSYFLSAPLLRLRGYRVARRVARQGGRVVVNGGNCPFPDVNWVHYVHAADSTAFSGPTHKQLLTAWKRRAHRRQERQAFRAARLLIANSERTRRDVIELAGIAEDRVRTVYLAADNELFRPASQDERTAQRQKLGWHPERLYLAFVGAPRDLRKNFATVVKAWQQLPHRPGQVVDLVVIGSADEAEQAKYPGSGPAAPAVHFLGLRKDVADILHACDALVAPVHYEAYGLAVHEALCCGLPAFVTATAGVAERYPEPLRQLLLTNADDVGDLADRLQQWRQAPRQLEGPLLALSESLRSYSWDDVARHLVDYIEPS